jgi:hypothetical protein
VYKRRAYIGAQCTDKKIFIALFYVPQGDWSGQNGFSCSWLGTLWLCVLPTLSGSSCLRYSYMLVRGSGSGSSGVPGLFSMVFGRPGLPLSSPQVCATCWWWPCAGHNY